MLYYQSVILVSLMSLMVLCILVRTNGRIREEKKNLLYVTYAMIAVSALAEWIGLRLDGLETLPKWPLMIAKCVDYTFTPMAGGALARQLGSNNYRKKAMTGLLICNAVLQVVSCFFGWMVRIDEHNVYSHGPLYWVYIVIYLAVIVLLIVEFIRYGKAYQRQNRIALYAIIVVVIVGIAAQELLGSEVRTSYMALTFGAALMFIHYSEFYQMASDDRIREQEITMSTDTLTGMLNRYAYAKALENFDTMERLPANTAAFSIDINGLKEANDNFGHAEGDKLICGAARCILRVFDKIGRCYRTGGDEFIVLARADRAQAEAALEKLDAEARLWTEETGQELSLAAGYALAREHADMSAEKLVIEADQAMYVEKNQYYREHAERVSQRRRDH